jgi:hypothetical protein
MGNIAKARQGYKPPTGTVQIVLDAELAKERKQLLDAIEEAREEAKGRPVTPKLKKLMDELTVLTEREREHVHKLRITKLPGLEWADLAAKYPPRLDVQFDLELGYNHHAASIAAAQSTIGEGDDAWPVTVEIVQDGEKIKEVPLDADDWAAILEVGAGWDVDNIVNLVINLNVLQASNRLGRLKKD